MRSFTMLLAVSLAIPASGVIAAGYTPVSQLLKWCKSSSGPELGICRGYIYATVEAATQGESGPDSERYLTAGATDPELIVRKVVSYLGTVPMEDASSPAGPMVLRALRKPGSSENDS